MHVIVACTPTSNSTGSSTAPFVTLKDLHLSGLSVSSRTAVAKSSAYALTSAFECDHVTRRAHVSRSRAYRSNRSLVDCSVSPLSRLPLGRGDDITHQCSRADSRLEGFSFSAHQVLCGDGMLRLQKRCKSHIRCATHQHVGDRKVFLAAVRDKWC